jgi:predicted dehydrogenase
MKAFGVAIVGCGLIGQKRAAVLAELEDCRLVMVSDVDFSRAQALAASQGCGASPQWLDAVRHADVDIVIVSTSNDALADVTMEACRNKKHVLCEKPFGRNVAEATLMAAAAREHGVILKIGFNHRFHPGISKAYELVKAGMIGSPWYVRGVYGHGGRLGYERDWRANSVIAGGGEMLDQGIHVIDLASWFLGDFDEVAAITATYFWSPEGSASLGSSVEDNAFIWMRTAIGQVASLHASWTQWKNRFTFETYGEAGFVTVEGLNGSYGAETVTWGQRRSEFGPPLLNNFEFNGPDRSWHDEWAHFVESIRSSTEPMSHGSEALKVMQLVDALYASSRLAKMVRVHSSDADSEAEAPVDGT